MASTPLAVLGLDESKTEFQITGHVLVSLLNNPDLRICKAYPPSDLYTNIADIIRHP